MKEIIVYLPESDNNGNDFEESIFQEFEERITALTGGITEKGKNRGLWKSEKQDTIMEDINREYQIITEAEKFEEIKQILEEYKEIMQQEALFTKFGDDFQFL